MDCGSRKGRTSAILGKSEGDPYRSVEVPEFGDVEVWASMVGLQRMGYPKSAPNL